MLRFLFYALIFTLIYSCSDSEINEEIEEMEEETPIESLSCHEDIDVNERTCANYINEKDSIYCEPEYLGSYSFDDVVKKSVKVYCVDSISTIHFQNSSNEIMDFNIINFSYSSDRFVNWTNFPCPSDTTRKLNYCFEKEQYSIFLESEDTLFHFTIHLETQPIFVGEYKGKYYDNLNIFKRKSSNSFTLQAKLVFGNGDSIYDYKNVSGQEYYESIELNNIEYFDVLSDDISNHTPTPIKFYFSHEKGLVGFLTPEGELYNLIE